MDDKMTELADLPCTHTHINSISSIDKYNNSENVECSEPITFRELQRENSVYKYYVELKDDVFTERGYIDLIKVPGIYVSGAGQFLKDLRNNNGFSQNDIAKILHVKPWKVSHWENNQYRMPLHQLVRITEAGGFSRNTIYSLIDQGKFSTKHNIPVRFCRIRSIIKYFNPQNEYDYARITLLKHCPEETISKIKEQLNVNPITSNNHKAITCRELYNFLTTFFQYSKVPKICPPLTRDGKQWYNNSIDLKHAVICPCLQSDGSMDQVGKYYRIRFCGKNKILHDLFVDAMYYEYNVLPISYFKFETAGTYYTRYESKSTNKIANELMNFAGNTKTGPAHEQTVAEYLKEVQPHIDYLMTTSENEQKIALRFWISTEGSVTVHRMNGLAYPRLELACAHPDLAKQLQHLARLLNINFTMTRSKSKWSRIQGLCTSALGSCLQFLKLGGFIKGVKIGGNSPYHEGIAKDVLLLGILEYKKCELENRNLKKLPIQQVHYKINKIIKNSKYKAVEYYINYFI